MKIVMIPCEYDKSSLYHINIDIDRNEMIKMVEIIKTVRGFFNDVIDKEDINIFKRAIENTIEDVENLNKISIETYVKDIYQ